MKIIDFKDWNARSYLDHYYTTGIITFEEKKLLRVIIQFLKNHRQHFNSALEFGSGPTIHRVIPLAPYVNKIYIADYLQKNLDEINKWLKKNTGRYDWNMYIKYILKNEHRRSDRSAVQQRERLIFKKTQSLLKCNIFKKMPLGKKKNFPLVTSFYCADSICTSKKQWVDAMNNLCTLVSGKGWLLLAALKNAKMYRVGDMFFPSADINEKDIRKILLNNNFLDESIDIKTVPAKLWINHGFNSIIITIAQKKA